MYFFFGPRLVLGLISQINGLCALSSENMHVIIPVFRPQYFLYLRVYIFGGRDVQNTDPVFPRTLLVSAAWFFRGGKDQDILYWTSPMDACAPLRPLRASKGTVSGARVPNAPPCIRAVRGV